MKTIILLAVAFLAFRWLAHKALSGAGKLTRLAFPEGHHPRRRSPR